MVQAAVFMVYKIWSNGFKGRREKMVEMKRGN